MVPPLLCFFFLRFLGKTDINAFDTILIYPVYAKQYIVIRKNDFVLLRKMIEKTETVSSDGIIVVGFKMNGQRIADIIQIGGSKNIKSLFPAILNISE